MQRTMTVKGFIVILSLILAVFLTFHLLMKGDLSRKAEQEEELAQALAKLQEEEKDLKNQLNIVGWKIIPMSRKTISGLSFPIRKRCTHIRRKNCGFSWMKWRTENDLGGDACWLL